MLDAEARMLLDIMEKAVQDGRPKLNTLPYAVGRQAVDKMSEDSEADPPQVGETSPEILTREMRGKAVRILASLAPGYPKLVLNQYVLDAYLNPPQNPSECIFASMVSVMSTYALGWKAIGTGRQLVG